MKRFFLILCLIGAAQLCLAESKVSPKQRTAAPGPKFSGTVTETMNAASYTYVLLDTGKQKVWVAAVQFNVKKGDTVAVNDGMPMENYHSKTLNRDFDLVYFAGDVAVNGKSLREQPAELPAGHPPIAASKSDRPKGHPAIPGGNAPPKIDFSGIKKVAGGKTVAEVHAEKSKLKDKPIAVRGRVVKYNAAILGKNWLHIQDGTANQTLVITTDSKVKLGDLILVKGKVSTDRDFGSGYKYGVMVEDAHVTVE